MVLDEETKGDSIDVGVMLECGKIEHVRWGVWTVGDGVDEIWYSG